MVQQDKKASEEITADTISHLHTILQSEASGWRICEMIECQTHMPALLRAAKENVRLRGVLSLASRICDVLDDGTAVHSGSAMHNLLRAAIDQDALIRARKTAQGG